MSTDLASTSHDDLAVERRALERFIVDNDDLLKLESRIGRFNIFDALGITRIEIRHSNFLAFILDPAESHGQGQLFLKAVLMDLLKKSPPELRPFSPIELDGTDLRGVDVHREWKNLDVLITCKEPRFAVVIENKVDSQEHSDQLDRYQATMKGNFGNTPVLYVYLTPMADKSSEESWVPYSYADIHRVLERVRDTYLNSIGHEVLVFLNHYLNLLGTHFMNSKELDDLCRKIYKEHRQALDLIWERVGTPEAGALVEMATVLEQDARWHNFYRARKYLGFVPKSWLEWLPSFGPEDEPQYWIIVELAAHDTRLTSSVFVMPMRNAAKRRDIVTKLREESPGLGFKRCRASDVGAGYARIAATETILEWKMDDEPDPETIREAVRNSLDLLYPRLEKLGLVLKRLCNLKSSRTNG